MVQEVLFLLLTLDDKYSIHILHPKSKRFGGGGEGLLFKILYIQVSYNGADLGVS